MTDQIKEKLSEEERDTIESTIKNSLDWLDSHQSESHEVYTEKQSEVEGLIKPIITKLYEDANNEPQPAEAGGDGAPTVEEVD